MKSDLDWLGDLLCLPEEPLQGSFVNSISRDGAERLRQLRAQLADFDQCREDWKATERAGTYQIAGLTGTLTQALRKLHPQISDYDLRRMVVEAAEAGRPRSPATPAASRS